MSAPARQSLPRIAFVLWIAGTGLGFALLCAYSSTSGAAASPPPLWPAGTGLRPFPGRETLLLFLHSHCPCSRATVAEFARLHASLTRPLNVYVLLRPAGGGASRPEDSALHAAAMKIPGVEVLLDRDGAEARRFQARTSGETMVYDAAGCLRFHGGITGARGHEGDSVGRRSVVDLLTRGETKQAETPVYGCPLFESP